MNEFPIRIAGDEVLFQLNEDYEDVSSKFFDFFGHAAGLGYVCPDPRSYFSDYPFPELLASCWSPPQYR